MLAQVIEDEVAGCFRQRADRCDADVGRLIVRNVRRSAVDGQRERGLIVDDSAGLLWSKAELPSVAWKGSSSMPQTKADRRPSPVAGHREQVGRISLNLASDAGSMDSQDGPVKWTPNSSRSQEFDDTI